LIAEGTWEKRNGTFASRLSMPQRDNPRQKQREREARPNSDDVLGDVEATASFLERVPRRRSAPGQKEKGRRKNACHALFACV
jgi:hypothetical protein